MSDKERQPDLTYQTPSGALRGDPPKQGGLRRALLRGVHHVTVLREEDGLCLVSAATFYGWVRPGELKDE